LSAKTFLKHLGDVMKRRIAASALLLLAAAANGVLAAEPSAKLQAKRNAAGEVVATVSGTVRACGLTATNDEPTFVVRGNTVEVMQPVAGIACMNPPPETRPYRRTLNLGKLPAGSYAIHWSFPDLTVAYTVKP
jgi:hypothetical protein